MLHQERCKRIAGQKNKKLLVFTFPLVKTQYPVSLTLYLWHALS